MDEEDDEVLVEDLDEVNLEDLDEAVKHLREEMNPGDIVITLGAGNVNRICDDLLEDAP